MQIVTKLLADLAVSTAKLANLAVTTAKLDNLAVTTAKIAADAVTGAKMRLDNAEWFRARNAANSADLDLIRANASDQTEIDGQTVFVDALAPQSAAAPLTGNDLCNKTYVDAQVGGGNSVQIESRTVTAGEATAKQLTLGSAPASATNVSVAFGGVVQFVAVDFSVTGAVLDWNALGMDTIGVVAGDQLVITYYV